MHKTKQLAIAGAVTLALVSGHANARWVSVDPVQANPNTGTNFNRYWYANNNPYAFKDPDGRIVKYAFSNGATVSDGAAVLNHWLKSETARGEIARVAKSDATYTVSFNRGGKFKYDEDTRTIHIDVTSGLRVESTGEIQSPALGGAHELSHAAQHDRVGTDAFVEASTRPQSAGIENGVLVVSVGIAPEEARATNVETNVANDLGEASRNNYHDVSGTVTTCSPTGTPQC